MPGLMPKALTKLTRYPIIALPYDRNAEAVPRELIIDYDTGCLYVKNEAGQITELTQRVNASGVYIRLENGDIVTLESLLQKIILKNLDVKEVNEMAIFKIPNEAQFDLKSVILKNNLVQVYNFDQAQEDSIPMKIDDRIVWVHRDTFLRSVGLTPSAEGTFTIEDLLIQSDHPFQSVTVIDAKNELREDIEAANGAYTATDDNLVWVRTVASDTFTAKYNKDTNQWSIEHPTITVASASVQTTSGTYNHVALLENKKQQTIIPSGLELTVYLPETTGDLQYSKIIWKVLSGDIAPILTFKTTSGGQEVIANNIVWEFAKSDPILKSNTNNFYIIETWDNGRSWFGRKQEMGRTKDEVDDIYVATQLAKYYTKDEVDEFTNWTITP